MTPIIVIFKCGHKTECERTVDTAPKCPQCGERVVARVLNAAPRFKGACQGPLVTT